MNVQENERLSYRRLLAFYDSTGNAEAVKELGGLAPYPGASPAEALKKLEVQRKWLTRAGGYTWRRLDDHYFDVVTLSPVYSEEDIQSWGKGIDFSLKAPWPEVLAVNFDSVTRFECPVILFHGRDDLTGRSQSHS